MRKDLLTAVVMLLLSLLSCGRNRANDGEIKTQEVPKLLATVSSDAVFVLYADEWKEAEPYLKEDSPFSKIDYGALADNELVLAWSYAGSMVPVLSMDLGKHASDSLLRLSISKQAKARQLYASFQDEFLLLSPSEARLNASLRHIAEKKSICDQHDFMSALSLAGSAKNFILLKTSATERLLKALFPNTQFIRNFSDYIIFIPEKTGMTVRTYQGEGADYYANLLSNLPFGNSRIDEMMPEDTDLAIALPLPHAFRDAYELFLDASSQKSSYDRYLSNLKSEHKMDLKKWERDNSISEVALLHFGDNDRVVLLRSEKELPEITVRENTTPGLCSMLYGPLFQLKDDSHYACTGSWHIYGPKKSVLSFVNSIKDKLNEVELPSEDIHLLIYEPDSYLSWGKKGIKNGISVTK